MFTMSVGFIWIVLGGGTVFRLGFNSLPFAVPTIINNESGCTF